MKKKQKHAAFRESLRAMAETFGADMIRQLCAETLGEFPPHTAEDYLRLIKTGALKMGPEQLATSIPIPNSLKPAACEAAYTPTPWKFSFESIAKEWAIVTGPGGCTVANVNTRSGPDAASAPADRIMPGEHNAAFIVRACNSHATFVVALQNIANAGESGPLSTATMQAIKAEARSALDSITA